MIITKQHLPTCNKIVSEKLGTHASKHFIYMYVKLFKFHIRDVFFIYHVDALKYMLFENILYP